MARACERVPAYPARTVAEAIQAVWILFLALHQESTNAGLSIGRLDQWLQPYLDRDLEQATDDAERRRIIEESLTLATAGEPVTRAVFADPPPPDVTD